MANDKRVLYGAYGSSCDTEMMKSITGNAKLISRSAILQDVELCVQRLDQIPDTVTHKAPIKISPKALMTASWGENSGFETYVIRPAKGKSVLGCIFELTDKEMSLVEEWELVNIGWHKTVDLSAILDDGTRVIVSTQSLSDQASVDRIVDGMNYSHYLNDRNAMLKKANQVRREFLSRGELS